MKSDVIILELIKYLVNNDKQVLQRVEAANDSEQPGTVMGTNLNNKKETIDLKGFQESITSQLMTINKKVEEISEQIKKLHLAPTPSVQANTNGSVQNVVATSSSSSDKELYFELIDENMKGSEYFLQTILSSAFLANGKNKNYFLWSTVIQQNPCALLFQSDSDKLGTEVLNLIVRQILDEMPYDIQKVEDLMRFVNKKMFEFFNKHASMPKSIKVGCYLVDKRKAKVFFAGTDMNLIRVSPTGIHVFEGNKEKIGEVKNDFETLTVDIQRGSTFYLSGANKVENELEQLWKKNLDKNAVEKKSMLNQWLTDKNVNDVILGMSF